jgi:hypothetical protein
MPHVNSIQEGGCTTPPRLPVERIPDATTLPVLACLSPAGVVGVLWMAAKLNGPEVESISFLVRAGGVALAFALAASATALWRAVDRESRVLSGIGLVGNALLLIGGIAYVLLR